MRTRPAVLSCLVAAVCVGASIAVTPFIVHVPALAGQAVRYALAAVVLGALLPRLEPDRPRRVPTRGQLTRIALAAATGSAGFNVLLVAASRRAEPAVIGAVVGASPVVLALLGAPRIGRRWPRPRPRVVLGATAASGGVLVVHAGAMGGSGHASTAGLLLAVAVLGCEVAFTLVVAPVLADVGPARVSAWNCGFAAAMLALASAATGESLRPLTGVEAATLGYQAVVMTALAFVLWYRGVTSLGPDRAGTTMAAAPVAATLTAAVLGTGRLTPATAAGACLAALGVLLAVRAGRRDDAPARPGAVSDAAQRPVTAGAGGRTAPPG